MSDNRRIPYRRFRVKKNAAAKSQIQRTSIRKLRETAISSSVFISGLHIAVSDSFRETVISFCETQKERNGMLKDIKKDTSCWQRVFIENAEEKEGKNGPYTNVRFTDGEMSLTANKWVPLSNFPYKGKVVDMELISRNGYVNIGKVTPVDDADITQYVRHAPLDAEAGFSMLQKYVEAITRENIQSVTEWLLMKNKTRFITWSAAKSVHHNYMGGLLYHTCRMAANVNSMCRVYKLDYSLLMGGTILHDIGKLYELSMDEVGNAEYTPQGNLFGHLYIGAELVDKTCQELKIDPTSEDIVLLKHMILSHHNLPEMGAVVMPAIKEAYILSQLDMIDSRIWIMENELPKAEPGTCTARIGSFDGRSLYRPTWDTDLKK